MATASTALLEPRQRIRKRRERGSFTALLLADLCRSALVLAALHIFVFNFSLVRGSSMQPNIHDGDRLVVDKVSYALGDVDRFDVVILACPKDPRVDYVKRVVGLPGDRITFVDGTLHVNEMPVLEPFAHVDDSECHGSWTVPDGKYFVVGDNRPVSSDSREGWFVARDFIRGKVRACFWPVSRWRVF